MSPSHCFTIKNFFASLYDHKKIYSDTLYDQNGFCWQFCITSNFDDEPCFGFILKLISGNFAKYEVTFEMVHPDGDKHGKRKHYNVIEFSPKTSLSIECRLFAKFCKVKALKFMKEEDKSVDFKLTINPLQKTGQQFIEDFIGYNLEHEYSVGWLKIDNFFTSVQNERELYSNIVYDEKRNGVRLLVYPNGMSHVKGQYLSVYLKLVSGSSIE